jgi:hypothetical protein
LILAATGGYSQAELEEAGAFRVYADPADILEHIVKSGDVKGTIRIDLRYHFRTKRRPPTPFDINQLHLVVALSQQHSIRESAQPLVGIASWKASLLIIAQASPAVSKTL